MFAPFYWNESSARETRLKKGRAGETCNVRFQEPRADMGAIHPGRSPGPPSSSAGRCQSSAGFVRCGS